MHDQGTRPKRKPVKEVPVAKNPGIWKRGTGERGGKPYIVYYRYRGKQHKKAFRTLDEAREFKSQRGVRNAPPPPSRDTFETYARKWIEQYVGRTARGVSDDTRESHRNAIERYAIPFFARSRWVRSARRT